MKKYKKLFISLFFSALTIATFSQSFHNLNFEQSCDTSKTGLCYWDLSWGDKGSVIQENLNGRKCLLIKGTKENSVGWTEQSSFVNFSKGMQILTVSALISTENIEGKGTGFNINLYDKDGNFLGFKDMGGVYSIDWLRGTKGWKKYSVSVVCPIETGKINIGAILYGKGNARFKDYKVTFSPIANRKANELSVQYISAACDTIALHSLKKDSIDIIVLKKTALKIAGTAKKYSDCYLAIEYLLESLRQYGDFHSFFMKADAVTNWINNGSEVKKIKFPTYKIIDEYGYIEVPGFHGGNQKIILAFADSTQHIIKILASSNIKGWIIDLRQNDGGNQEPMIAGLGPLFSSEKLGALIDVNNKADGWYYKDGKYWGDGYEGCTVSNPVSLKEKLPIAVLTSNQVGSSGEIVTISFIGNYNTKSFGQPTMGLTTGNGSFDLADESKMYLASTVMSDRNGKLYHGSIEPDFPIENKTIDGKDIVIKAAIEWIKSRL